MALSERLCPVCGKPMEVGAAPVVCDHCHNLYHIECWDTIDRCVAFGCRHEALGDNLTRAVKESSGKITDSVRLSLDKSISCPSCQQVNHANGTVCLACSKLLYPLAESERFVSYAGWQASTPEELVSKLNLSWEAGIQHLYLGDLEYWFTAHGKQDYAELANKARTGNTQRSIGLESFLQSTGLVEAPKLEVSTNSVLLEGMGPVLEAVVDIRNAGRGYLSGKVLASESWIGIDQQQFAGNLTRLLISVNVAEFSSDSKTGQITIDSIGGKATVEVRAKRVSIVTALEMYRQGDTVKARALCRRLMDSRMSGADSALLTAACYIQEDNDVGATSALRKLSGASKLLDSDIITLIFEWLQKDDSNTLGLMRLDVYEALLPCVDAAHAEQLKKALAECAMSSAHSVVDSGGSSGVSLWRGGRSVANGVQELLDMAVAYDSALAPEAKAVHGILTKRLWRSRASKALWAVVLIALLAGAGYLGWSTMGGPKLENIEEAVASQHYDEALEALEVLKHENPDNVQISVLYATALAGKSREMYEQGLLRKQELLFVQAKDAADGRPEATKAVAGVWLQWANDLRKASLLGEARIRLEQAAALEPENPQLQALRASLATNSDTYYELYKIANGELGRQSIEKYHMFAGAAKDVQKLSQFGAMVYGSHLMVAFADITGDGVRELVVAGTNTTGKEPNIVKRGEYAIYKVDGNRVSSLYKGQSVKSPVLARLLVDDFSGARRYDAVLCWTNPEHMGQVESVFLAYRDKRFVTEAAPCLYQISIDDRSGDGVAEVWIPELVSDSIEGGDLVMVYKPFLWKEPGFVEAKGNFAKYYRECIARLKEEMDTSSLGADDPRRATYKQDRQKAIAIIERLLSTYPEENH